MIGEFNSPIGMLRRVTKLFSNLNNTKVIPFPTVNIYSKFTPSNLIETDYQIFEQENHQQTIQLDSVKRKRVLKMKRHKLKKRRKANRKK